MIYPKQNTDIDPLLNAASRHDVVSDIGSSANSKFSRKNKIRAVSVLAVAALLAAGASRLDSNEEIVPHDSSTQSEEPATTAEDTARVIRADGSLVFNEAIDGKIVCDPSMDDCTAASEEPMYEFEAGDIRISGTAEVFPEDNEGFRAGVLREAAVSKVALNEVQLDVLTDITRALNTDENGVTHQPMVGQAILVPNILGDPMVDQTPLPVEQSN